MAFLLLLIAHILTDFVLQPHKWVRDKNDKHAASIWLYVHVVVTGAVAWLFLYRVSAWLPVLIIMITHFIIDLWKSYQKDTLWNFLIDQFLHLFVLFMVFILFFNGDIYLLGIEDWFTEGNLMKICAYLFVIFPAGYIVGLATKRWQEELEPEEGKERDSLKNAGRWIGIIERVLILTLVYLGQFGAIGFLIAAKSILRITDKTEEFPRKQTEYVLVGTLLSFTLAIIVGLLTL